MFRVARRSSHVAGGGEFGGRAAPGARAVQHAATGESLAVWGISAETQIWHLAVASAPYSISIEFCVRYLANLAARRRIKW